MIYTVTLNPAVDYVVNMDLLHIGTINRSENDYKEAGGKGINVSRVLKQFDEESIALGFAGGFTGNFITDTLTELNIKHQFVPLEEDTRINMKLKTATEETEVNGRSPRIAKENYEAFLAGFEPLKQDDIVILSGSVPNSLSKDVYYELITMFKEKSVIPVLDTSGEPLTESITASPFFIKPNNDELAELFNEEANNDEVIAKLAERLHQEFGIRHVLVSRAKEGAIYVGEGGSFKIIAPTGQVQKSVGSGDSTVAGFMYKWNQTQNAKEAAMFAVASGSATAFSKTLCTKEEVETILSEVSTREV